MGVGAAFAWARRGAGKGGESGFVSRQLRISTPAGGALTQAARRGYSFETPSRRNRGSRMPAPADPNATPSPSSPTVDDAEAKRAFREILQWIGEDPDRDGLKDTPARMVRAYREYFAGYETDPEEALRTTFTEVDGYDEMIVLRGVTFESHCEHHLAPIVGRAWVGYLPDRRVVGISKLARIVDIYARRLQIQERLTAQIANAIESVLKPRGVAVVVKATHHCMMSRGVRRHGADLVTSRMLGVFRDHAITRSEFLALVDSKSESP